MKQITYYTYTATVGNGSVLYGGYIMMINTGDSNEHQNESLLPADINGGGNPGGYYFNCEVDTKNVQNQGLKNLINQLATTESSASKIANYFFTIYGQSGAINLTFKEANIPASMRALAFFTRGDSSITIGKEVLEFCSKEYAAGVLVHEILHAVRYYFNSMGQTNQLEEHKMMAENSFNDMVLWLKEITGLNDYDAKCIILSTFEGAFEGAPFGNPNYFKNLALGVGITNLEDAMSKALEYRTGLTGTPL
jgi:hypothetical protein